MPLSSASGICGESCVVSSYYNETRTPLPLDKPVGLLSLRPFCPGCTISTRGYDFREGQVLRNSMLGVEAGMEVAGLILPVFAVIVTGWAAAQTGYVSRDLSDGLIHFAYNVAIKDSTQKFKLRL